MILVFGIFPSAILVTQSRRLLMPLWSEFVDLVYAILFGLAGAFGGNMGLAIGFLSLTFRLAVLPLTLRMAYRSLEVQLALKKLQPELSRIQTRHKGDPKRLLEETAKLHQRHGIKVMDSRGIITLLIQAPLFLGLFAAVQRGLSNSSRFLWIKDLMKSDPVLVFVCALLTGLSAVIASNAPEQQRTVAFLLPAVLTLAFLWRMAAGIGIYSLASGMVGLVQSLLIRRRLHKLAA
jgi:YidC/Oxa1 family membrane protein insertase